MAKRRRLETPGPEAMADLAARIDAGFAAKPVLGTMAPIAQIAGDAATRNLVLDANETVSIRQNRDDAEALRIAREAGRLIVDLPIEAIQLDHIARDRMVVEASELEELKTSIRTNGLRMPVEVIATGEGRYGLISGWRRLTVLAELAEEDPARFGVVPALVRAPAESGALYTAMIEENELRAQLSPYERGRIVVVAAKLGVFPDAEAALSTLFAAASKAKRSKIRSFALVYEELGDMLRFPTDLSERGGLRLAQALREGHVDVLRYALIRHADDAGQEWAILEAVLAKTEAILTNSTEALIKAARGGRPRTQQVPPAATKALILPHGIQAETRLDASGLTIRLSGEAINPELADAALAAIRDLLLAI